MKYRVYIYIIYILLFSMPIHPYAQGFPFYGRTIGTLPYFEYGPGDDRLGGAKMTYMDSNVLVKVVDSLGTDYIIELTKNLQAFVARTSIRIDSQYKSKAYQLSGNWKSYSDDRFDYIRIAMPERLPFRGAMQTGPSRLIIDLFGITSNTNWITQVGKASAIKNTWFEQIENGLTMKVSSSLFNTKRLIITSLSA